MLGDDNGPAAQAGSGYGPLPPISSAPGILPPPDWSAYGQRPQPAPAAPAASRPVPQQPRSALPARPLEQDWAAYAPKSQASSWLPEHLDLFPKEKLGGGDIFVGGGGVNLGKILPSTGLGVMRDYADGYAKKTGRPTAYFGNDQVPEVIDAIRQANQTDGPVNLIGHSWGGPDVYNAAARARQRGLRVDNVITLDPVSGPSGEVNAGLPAGTWTNVTATTSTPNASDALTHFPGLAQKPSTLPTSNADAANIVVAHHEDVGALMAHGPRQIIDRSRQLDPPHDWSDELPTWEWMQRRNSARPISAAKPAEGAAALDGERSSGEAKALPAEEQHDHEKSGGEAPGERLFECGVLE